MKIKELIETLSAYDPECEVVMSGDSEGNVFKTISNLVSVGIYVPENGWCGQFYDDQWDADDACIDEDEWNEMLEGPRTICIWPVN